MVPETIALASWDRGFRERLSGTAHTRSAASFDGTLAAVAA
jgi:hypothetical protein